MNALLIIGLVVSIGLLMVELGMTVGRRLRHLNDAHSDQTPEGDQ